MKKTQPKKPVMPASMRWVRWTIVLVAVTIPLFPIAIWFETIIPIYRSMWHGPMLILYLPARALGLVGFVMMVYQFVLSAKFRLIEKAFTRAVIFRRHRTLGKIGFLLIFLHGTAMLAFDIAMSGGIQLDTPKMAGLIALILLTIAVAVAIFWKPLKLSNKQWMRIHRLTYLVLPLAFYHAVTMGTTLNTSQWIMGLFYALGAVYLVVTVRRVWQAVREVRTRRTKPVS